MRGRGWRTAWRRPRPGGPPGRGAFIKELVRGAVQFGPEPDGAGGVAGAGVDRALDEMLFRGGSVNLKQLGAAGANGRAVCGPAVAT